MPLPISRTLTLLLLILLAEASTISGAWRFNHGQSPAFSPQEASPLSPAPGFYEHTVPALAPAPQAPFTLHVPAGAPPLAGSTLTPPPLAVPEDDSSTGSVSQSLPPRPFGKEYTTSWDEHSTTKRSNSLNTKQKIGIGFGIFFLSALALFGLVVYRKRRRNIQKVDAGRRILYREEL